MSVFCAQGSRNLALHRRWVPIGPDQSAALPGPRQCRGHEVSKTGITRGLPLPRIICAYVSGVYYTDPEFFSNGSNGTGNKLYLDSVLLSVAVPGPLDLN